MGFDFRSIQKAPKGAGGKKCLSREVLCYELGLGVLRLSLADPPTPVEREALKAVRPVLAAKYTKRYDTIHTYLGAGREDDGLGLHRHRAGAYPVCRENAALALARLEQLGHPPAAVAALLGTGEEALLAAVAALPPFDATAAPPAAPAAAATTGGPPAPATGDAPRDAKEAAKEARAAAREEKWARVRQEANEIAGRRDSAEADAEHQEQVNNLLSHLDDEE
jgi:hypothetical protein